MIWTLLLSFAVLSVSHSLQLPFKPNRSSPRPLVIWHGLGDTAFSDGINSLIDDLKDLYPGIFVYSVMTPMNGTADDERKAGFYGNATLQVDQAVESMALVPELARGFDAIGFSQGGLFMRDYVQRYNDPPVHNFITFGSPHLGIAKALLCAPRDFLCKIASASVERSAYTKWAQANLIQAGYLRDHNRLEGYYQINEYLTRLNGELEIQPLAQKNIASLTNLVLIRFSEDKTVYPSISSHFGSLTPNVDDEDESEIPLIEQEDLWKKDSIGLKELSKKGGLILEPCEGRHMELGDWADTKSCLRRMVDEYVGWRQ